MKILFVNNEYNLFAAADCGASQRSMRYIRALTQVGHVDVVSFVDNTISNMDGVDVLYSQSLEHVYHRENRISKYLKLFDFSKPYKIYPPHPEKEKIIDDIVSTHDYDIIVVRYIHFACHCGLLKYADKLIIDIDDDPKQVVLMNMEKIKTLRNRLYHWFFARTIDIVSRNVVKSVKRAFYSSPDMGYANAQFLPNISIFQDSLPPAQFTDNPPTIMMVGWFKYSPNIEGLTHFVKNVFPYIKQAIPSVKLNVVGNMANEELRELCLRTNGINLRGFVEDIKKEYNNSQCVVVPIYKGTGTSVKLVEAMSLGRSVVATPCGSRGLNPAFIDGQDFYIAKSDKSFADRVVYLLTHPKENIKMADSALVKIKKYYSEEMFNQTIISCL